MSEAEFQPQEIRHFIYAADPGVHDGFYAVLTQYPETDAINAVGAVYRFYLADGRARGEVALNTNDGLDNIWASPQGNLWVGSAWGRVWTTADVPWDANDIAGLDWDQSDPYFRWKATEVPRNENGGRYNVAAIWGSSDSDVYFGTFEGVILHWDGDRWRVSHRENARPIIRMHGQGPKDIWAVGRDGLVLHFDGNGWRALPLPGDAEKGETLTGVWVLSSDEVYICSTSGAVFHGSQRGLERLGEFEQSFYGIVEYAGRLLLAGGDHGACELDGNRIEITRGSFAATGVYALGKRVGFVQPSQNVPRVVVYDPAAPTPWLGWGG